MALDVMTPCGTAPCGPTNSAGLERTRFYPRQLVTSDDLTQDQHYFRERQRRHNRLIHGWGIVCGACVRPNPQNRCEVIVDPGYVLGPYGDDIVIPEAVTFDLCKQGVAEQAGCCPELDDPWCGDTQRQCPEGRFFLAIRYAECRTRPVKTGGCSCGCEGDSCEHTRIRDSFALKVLTELPSSYSTPMQQPQFTNLLGCWNGVARACPPCSDNPWVILADLIVGKDCRVTAVDWFTHRRSVVSFGSFYLLCGNIRQPGVTGATVNTAGLSNYAVLSMVSGANTVLDVGSPVGATPHATVTMARADGTAVIVPAHFTVAPGTTVGDFLAREGDRLLYDPTINDTFTLRELYAHASVPPDTVLTGAASALSTLEGRTLDVTAVRHARAMVTELLDRTGLDRLDRELGGAVRRARELPATALAGIEGESVLGRKLSGMTIGDIAAKPKEEFVAAAVEGVAAKARKETATRAEAVWSAATRVANPGTKPTS